MATELASSVRLGWKGMVKIGDITIPSLFRVKRIATGLLGVKKDPPCLCEIRLRGEASQLSLIKMVDPERDVELLLPVYFSPGQYQLFR